LTFWLLTDFEGAPKGRGTQREGDPEGGGPRGRGTQREGDPKGGGPKRRGTQREGVPKGDPKGEALTYLLMHVSNRDFIMHNF
jgi:hypothetical protein